MFALCFRRDFNVVVADNGNSPMKKRCTVEEIFAKNTPWSEISLAVGIANMQHLSSLCKDRGRKLYLPYLQGFPTPI